MTDVVLAGDAGATKTDLALYAVEAGRVAALLREASFPSRHYGGLEEVVRAFLGGTAGSGTRGAAAAPGAAAAAATPPIAAAAFGVAGPVVDDAVTTVNLPWRVERTSLSRLLGGVPVRLLNDLEATAYGAPCLAPADLRTLNPGIDRPGNRAVIAAGTGLGQAFLHWEGAHYEPAATEGGHTDFAPRDEQEIALLRFLRTLYPRVSYERVLSGPGLHNIFRFLDEGLHRPVARAVRARLQHEDPGAVIGAAGVAGTCPTCAAAVEMFVGIYGAQAGNLALTVMATGGVYIAGGIVVKLLSKIATGSFMRAFTAKGRYADLMAEIPVHVILNPKTGQLGAAQAACALV